jgi:hypothetical protein
VENGGWRPYANGKHDTLLDGHDEWLRQSLLQHGGNDEVTRHALRRGRKMEVSLRTLERAESKHRAWLRALALATVGLEAPAGVRLDRPRHVASPGWMEGLHGRIPQRRPRR